MTLRALWKRCSPVMLTIAMVQTSLFWCVCFAFWWSPELHLLIACMCTWFVSLPSSHKHTNTQTWG